MLTICVYCKRMFVKGLAGEGLSHGICEECLARRYPGVPDQWLALLVLGVSDAAQEACSNSRASAERSEPNGPVRENR